MVTKNLFTLTLLKAIDILDCFEDDYQEIGIKEIAEMIDMPQSSVYRIIQSLEFIGMIFQDKENKKYRLGPKVMQMSDKVECLEKQKAIAIRYMERMNAECDENVNLAIADCDHIVNIHKVECSHLLRPNFVSGQKYEIYSTSLGKVLLTELSTAELRWVYEEHQNEIGRSFEDFKAEIDQVKVQGYAVDEEEFNEGLRCVGVPIYGKGGKILFSASISAPISRMNDEKFKKAIEVAVKYADLASKEIQSTKF